MMKLNLDLRVDTILTAIALTATLSLLAVFENSSFWNSSRSITDSVENTSIASQNRNSDFFRF